MVEPHRQQPLPGHMLVPGVAAARPYMGVQVGNRLTDASVVSVQHRPSGRRIAQAVQNRHALGRAQHHVEPRHRPLAVGPAEELAAVGVAALEHPPEARHRCFALHAK
jgi:hypothetical protein